MNQSSPVTERAAFIAAYPHLDLVEMPDAWGRPMFKHTHVQALWDGWFARACLHDHAQTPAAWQTAVDLTEKSILSEYYSGRINGDSRIREGFKNLRAALSDTSTEGKS